MSVSATARTQRSAAHHSKEAALQRPILEPLGIAFPGNKFVNVPHVATIPSKKTEEQDSTSSCDTLVESSPHAYPSPNVLPSAHLELLTAKDIVGKVRMQPAHVQSLIALQIYKDMKNSAEQQELNVHSALHTTPGGMDNWPRIWKQSTDYVVDHIDALEPSLQYKFSLVHGRGDVDIKELKSIISDCFGNVIVN
ncbi:hypothetical protein FA15DRAFT_660970 [Coprinopsis marcescibilis]|uniref:Uncharacterized protein n=1 Tax=Coprinopsis marcescibilis TaxID=230819 RepID=A0A5C3KEL9_COPMA|nr:hypothetical protein FA15DRAFT_660970 [Coprinopsis marcescibilis]